MENPTITSGFELEGTYHLDCFDNEAKRQEWLLTSYPSLIKWSGDIKNKIVNQGLNYLLNCIFYTTAKLSNAWYLGLVVTNTAATAGMTYATPTYTESTTGEAARQACTFVSSSAQSTTNSASPAVFTNGGATETVYGVCLVGANAACTTAGDTAATGGVLLSYGLLGSAQPWIASNVINATYTITDASTT